MSLNINFPAWNTNLTPGENNYIRFTTAINAAKDSGIEPGVALNQFAKIINLNDINELGAHLAYMESAKKIADESLSAFEALKITFGELKDAHDKLQKDYDVSQYFNSENLQKLKDLEPIAAQNATLKDEVTACQQEITRLLGESKKATDELVDTTNKLVQAQQVLDATLKDLANTKESSLQKQDVINALGLQVSNLQDEIDDLKNRQGNIIDKLLHLKEQETDLLEQKQALESQTAEKKQYVVNYENELNHTTSQIEQVKLDIANFDRTSGDPQDLKDLEDRLDALLQHEVKTNENKGTADYYFHEHLGNINKIEQQIQDTQKEIGSLNLGDLSTFNSLYSDAKALEKEKSDLENDLLELQLNLTQEQEKATDLAKVLATVQEQLHNLTEKTKLTEATHKTALETLENSYKQQLNDQKAAYEQALSDQADQAKIKEDTATDLAKDYLKQLSCLQKDHGDLQDQIRQLKADLATAPDASELVTARTERDTAVGAAKAATEALKQLQADFNKFKAAEESKYETLKTAKEAKDLEADNLFKRVQHLEQQMIALEKEKNDAEEEMNKTKILNEAFKKRIKELSAPTTTTTTTTTTIDPNDPSATPSSTSTTVTN